MLSSRRRTLLDLELEAGLGRVFSDDARTVGFGRGRLGLLFARPHLYHSLGLTYEYSRLTPATFGLQTELALPTGLWAQAGAMMDTQTHWGGMVAAGFAIVGIEGQYRDAESTGPAWAIYGKIRIPITLLFLAASASSEANEARKHEGLGLPP